MPSRPRVLFVWVVLAGSVCASPAAGQFAAGVNRETTKSAVSNFRVHGSYALSEFLRVRVTDGLLAPEMVAELPPNESVRVEIEGSEQTWVARNRNIGSPYLTVTRYDFAAPADGLWSVSLTMRNGYVAVYAQTGDVAAGTRARLIQSNRSLRLMITEGERGIQNTVLSVTADSIQQLQKEHPEAVRRYLAPALRMISGHYLLRPGPVDVYRLFPSIPASPKAARDLEAVILQLDAPSYADREQASRALADLGTPGVLAAVRRPKADLSEEALNRLNAFLASQTNLAIDDLAASRADPYLLLDCLDDDDPAIRAAAKTALAQVLGAAVEFEPAAADAARLKSLDKVRQQVDRFARIKAAEESKPATPAAAPKPRVWIE